MAPILRNYVVPEDRAIVAGLCRRAGNFSLDETTVAEELVTEALEKGAAAGYYFLFAEEGGRTLGYVCFGPIAGTDSSWDLYWLVVDPEAQKAGLGELLMRSAEREATTQGATKMYVDTSSRPDYRPARSFYQKQGCRAAAELPDFYRPGDNKIIFEKILTPQAGS